MEDVDEWEEEEEILDNATHCPACDELTGHEILREKSVGTGADFMVRCNDCQHTVDMLPSVVRVFGKVEHVIWECLAYFLLGAQTS